MMSRATSLSKGGMRFSLHKKRSQPLRSCQVQMKINHQRQMVAGAAGQPARYHPRMTNGHVTAMKLLVEGADCHPGRKRTKPRRRRRHGVKAVLSERAVRQLVAPIVGVAG